MTVSAAKASAAALLAGLVWSFSLAAGAQESAQVEEEAPQPSRPQSLLPGRIDAPEPLSSGPEPILPGAASAPPAQAGTADVPQTAASGPSAPPVEGLPLVPTNDLTSFGPLTRTTGGYGPALWNGSRGSFVTAVLPKLPTPVGSRFGQITLRRALASEATVPAGADPIPFHAARVNVLLRLGEADLASRLAATVPQQAYNRNMYVVAGQAHLAAFNVPATCPLASRAIVFSPDNIWPLLSAVCSAIQGDDSGAALGIDIARQSETLKVNKFDLYLADRMLTAVAGGGRGGVIDWPKDGLLTTFRLAGVYGGGQSLPISAFKQKNSAVYGWIAKSGMVDSTTRFVASWSAVATGVLTTDEWIGLWAQRGSQMSPAQLAYAPEGLLLRANTAPYKERVAVMKQLWKMGSKNPRADLSMRLLTSDAAARLPQNPMFLPDLPDLVRSMILGGRFAEARAWWPYLQTLKTKAAQAAALEIWAGLELTDWKNAIPANAKLLEAWVSTQPADVQKRRGQLMVGALKGLGYGFAATADVPRIDDTPSGAALDRLRDATKRRAQGEVIVLGSLLMGEKLDSISPETLQEVTRAYRAVGLVAEARLIAAEVILQAGRDQ
jgi:hypothetical protein